MDDYISIDYTEEAVIKAYGEKSRIEFLEKIEVASDFLEDREMLHLIKGLIPKIKRMTDAEYEKLSKTAVNIAD